MDLGRSASYGRETAVTGATTLTARKGQLKTPTFQYLVEATFFAADDDVKLVLGFRKALWRTLDHAVPFQHLQHPVAGVPWG